jgi:hypothetical protein
MVTLADDSRVHVAVSAFAFARDPDHDCRRSTFVDRHLFIQSFYLQVVVAVRRGGLNLA